MKGSEVKDEAESAPATSAPSRVLAVLNPKAGSATGAAIHKALGTCFDKGEHKFEIHETKDSEDLGALIRDRMTKGVDLVVACGGDGTVGAVANALVGTDTLLGIVPMGTANVLARELEIPLDLHAACGLLVGEHGLARIDVMKVGGRHYLTQVGVGLDALMIRDTPAEHKRRFGKAAYLWTAARHLFGHQPQRFFLEIDGKSRKTRASQVIVANVGTLGQPPFRWGPDIQVDDGMLDVCVVKAKTLLHYGALFWHVIRGKHKADPNVRYDRARHSVAITSNKVTLVQADGEVLGETPVRIEVVPGALRVIVPKQRHRAV
jgi:diacylglycerol kinase (ATP)